MRLHPRTQSSKMLGSLHERIRKLYFVFIEFVPFETGTYSAQTHVHNQPNAYDTLQKRCLAANYLCKALTNCHGVLPV